MTDLVTVTLPREQWEAVVKAIDLGLKGFKPAEQVLGKYKDKMNVTDAEIIKVQEGIIKDYAEELERLKKCVEEIENNRHIEPIAWMLNGKLHDCDPSDWAKDEYPDEDVIPLYTKPQNLTLSDEEIEQLREYHGINDWLYETSVIDFAKAILKKASEK